jgi:crotonobetainyl-CoA:carnitine CoA-transferase CaiB-like acyl-CoA transferase
MSEQPSATGALAGLRVMELGDSPAVAFAGRWLAASGAEVIKVEPPSGDPARHHRLLDGPNAPVGSLHAFLNAGKRSVVVDLGDGDAAQHLAPLLAGADAVLHDFDPAAAARLGLDPALLRRIGTVSVAVSPLGWEGPYAGFAASDLTLLALGGFQFLSGEPGREPLGLPGHQASYLTGAFAAIAALAGLAGVAAGGRALDVEVTALECLASLHQITHAMWRNQGVVRSRHGSRWENLYPITLLPCRDGLVGFSLPTQEQWERLCGLMERPDLLEDQRYLTNQLRHANADSLDVELMSWLRGYGKMELFHRAQTQWRLPVGPLYGLDEVLAEPQYRHRGFWQEAGGLLQPGLPVRLSSTPWRLGPAPALDEAAGLVVDARPAVSTPAVAAPASDSLPLAGVRVLDFTQVWAGPLACRILADLGAEVIRVERPVSLPADAPEERRREAVQAVANLARRSSQGEFNRNKLAIAVDLQRKEGRDIVRRLAAFSDILVENFTARVMPNFGLGYEELSRLNPALIFLAMPGYGGDGPYREYTAYGPSIEPMTGLCELLGYRGEGPLASAIAYPDAVAGVTAALAALTALVHQRRTGRGQLLDLSQVEATTLFLGEYFVDYQRSGRTPPRAGNRHPFWAPQGTYRCRGKDEWLSLTVSSDDEWRRLADAIGAEALSRRRDLESAAGRRRHADEIDAAIASWTAERDKWEAMRLLQAAGVAAGALANARELREDPQLAHFGFFVQAHAADGAVYELPGTPLRVSGRPRPEWRAAPLPGEDNAAVLGGLLGMSRADVASLEERGVLGRLPPTPAPAG